LYGVRRGGVADFLSVALAVALSALRARGGLGGLGTRPGLRVSVCLLLVGRRRAEGLPGRTGLVLLGRLPWGILRLTSQHLLRGGLGPRGGKSRASRCSVILPHSSTQYPVLL